MLLQSFADFSTDCSAVGVINIDGVAHDGPRCPNESRPIDHPKGLQALCSSLSLWRISESLAFALARVFASRSSKKEPRETPLSGCGRRSRVRTPLDTFQAKLAGAASVPRLGYGGSDCGRSLFAHQTLLRSSTA